MDLKAVERSIIAHTNKERKNLGRPRVQAKRNMNAAARSHSQHMAEVRKLAHEGIGDGTPESRALEHNCGEGLWSENCQGLWSNQFLKFYKTTENELGKKAVENWMKSRPHRKNLLKPDWVAMGAGAGQSRDGGIYLTQIFGPTERMADEELVALCPICKSQNIRTRTTPHEKNLWRCLKCNQVFPTPCRAFRRPAKRHVLPKDIARLENGVRILSFIPQLPAAVQRRKAPHLGTAMLATVAIRMILDMKKRLRAQ